MRSMSAVRRRAADILFLLPPMFFLRQTPGYHNSLLHLKIRRWPWYTGGKKETQIQNIPSKKIFGGFLVRPLSIPKFRCITLTTQMPLLGRVFGKKKNLTNIYL